MAYSAFTIPFGGAVGGDGKSIRNIWNVSLGHSFVPGNIVRYSAGGVALAQADSISNVQSVGVVASKTATTITIVYQGEVDFGTDALTSIVGGAESLVAGNIYYISQSNAGMLDPSRPSDGYVQAIFVATGEKTGIVINSLAQSETSTGVSVNTIGMIVPWAGDATTIPENWKLCDGEAVRKSGSNPLDSIEYADLYGVIGDKYHITGLIDTITGPDIGQEYDDLVVSFLHGHAEYTPALCHGLCNAWDNSENLDFKIGWGGTNDFALASVILADGGAGTVRFRFKESYPGTDPISDWSTLIVGSPITIQSLESSEVAGYTSDRFFVPDMRARAAFGVGYSTGLPEMVRGEMGGKDVHLLTTNEIPDHSNVLYASDSPTSEGDQKQVINAGVTSSGIYETYSASFTADNSPLSMMPPYIGTNWIIRHSGTDAALPGLTGPMGPMGEVGPTGPIGPTGPKGETGSSGEVGNRGETGPIGSTGFGYTAAHVSGDGQLYMSILFPDGMSGSEYSLGTVVPSVGGDNHQVLFNSQGQATGSPNLQFDGSTMTFGGVGTLFTATGPTFTFGKTTRIVDGIFVNPQEDSHYDDNGTSNLLISGLNGTIQRFMVTPQANFTVGIASSAGHWNDETNVVQTVNIVLQSRNGITGTFASDILCPSPRPTFCGVTGGVDLLSLMRIKTAGGNVTMGFVVASGMTAADINIAN